MAASSSLDQREAATAATFAQPFAATATGFGPRPAADAPAPTLRPPLASSNLSSGLSTPDAWTSTALLGSSTQSASATGTARTALASAADPNSSQGGGAPRTPSAPPCSSGAGASGPGGSAGSGGAAGLPVATLGCLAPQGLQPNRLTPTLWRQVAFVSLQERPG